MDRQIGDRNVLDKFTLKFCEIAEKHVKYIVLLLMFCCPKESKAIKKLKP